MAHPEPQPPRREKRRLTDLELAIMHPVWEASPTGLTVREVLERMPVGAKAPAYTTIQTTMNILEKKGVLAIERGQERALRYHARITHEQATQSMTSDLVERLFGGSAQPLLSHLLDHRSVDREVLEELKREIEAQLADEAGSAPDPDQGGDR